MKIETVVVKEGNSVSCCPERGGIITSLKLGGREALFMDEAMLHDRNANVHGGIPILFPNAGSLEHPAYPLLGQHGFARDSDRWEYEKLPNGFVERLVSSKETLVIFPFNFRLTISGSFHDDDSFTITQEVENLEDTKDMPIAMGLHPYFKVPHDQKHTIAFNFPGGNHIQDEIDLWAQGHEITIDNPKIADPNALLEITIPLLGTLRIDASIEYQKIWIWSLPRKDFICIEPVMRDKGGLIDDPYLLKPSEVYTASITFSVK